MQIVNICLLILLKERKVSLFFSDWKEAAETYFRCSSMKGGKLALQSVQLGCLRYRGKCGIF